MFTLPNGKPIDTDMIEMAMEDADSTHQYYLKMNLLREGVRVLEEICVLIRFRFCHFFLKNGSARLEK